MGIKHRGDYKKDIQGSKYRIYYHKVSKTESQVPYTKANPNSHITSHSIQAFLKNQNHIALFSHYATKYFLA